MFAPYAAWALQTPQGAEVSIKLMLDTPTGIEVTTLSNSTSVSSGLVNGISAMNIDTISASSANNDAHTYSRDIGTSYTTQPASVHFWTGRVIVRCSDHATLQAVVADMEYLIYALSGGYMGMANQA